jgi:Fungalysin/Thermolysin Propeptide Motif
MTNRMITFFLVFTISCSCFSVNAASSWPRSQSKRDRLKQQPINKKESEQMTGTQKQALDALGSDVSVELDKRSLPSSIAGKLAMRANPLDPAMDALGCVDELSPAFRRRADDGFLTSSVWQDEQSVSHVRLAQTYKGINVVGGELTVDLTSSEVTGVKGSFIADLDLSTEPGITSDEAAVIALQFASDKVGGNPKVIGNRSPVVFLDQDKVAHLAIPVQVQYGDKDEAKSDDLFISATTGLILNPRLMGAGTASPVGDFNRDGTSNGKDSVDWIRAFGIRFRTYGVTDEVYNPGIYLPRRPWDYNVKMIGDGCLSSFGVSAEQFPPD